MGRRYYSPSECHKHVMANFEQELAFDPSDPIGWQQKLRLKLGELLGGMPIERVPLDAEQLWKREHELGTIEKLVFTSEAYSDVPAYACIPKDATPPYTWVICVQGHSSGMHNSIGVQAEDETQPLEVKGDRDFGINAMRYGVAALCIEQRCFGEREERKQQHRFPARCHDATCHALMLGRTMIGERVYDIDRAIDYLETRSDFGAARLGVMGNSGGGTATLFAAATLPRVQFAMPSCYFCTFAASIMSLGHCEDNYVPGLLKYAEMADVLGLFAPKPVVVVAGRHDEIFPVDATRKAFDDLKRIYAAFDAEERCQLMVGSEGHRFYADEAWPLLLNTIA